MTVQVILLRTTTKSEGTGRLTRCVRGCALRTLGCFLFYLFLHYFHLRFFFFFGCCALLVDMVP